MNRMPAENAGIVRFSGPGRIVARAGEFCYIRTVITKEVDFMKRTLIALLCLGLLAGCAADTNSTAAASAESTASAVSTPATADPNATPSIIPTVNADEKITITNPVQLNTTKVNMSGYEFLTDPNPAFVGISATESLRMFSEKGTGILYYGATWCPFCNRAVPELNAVAKELGVTVYYVSLDDQNMPTATLDALKAALDSILTTDSEGKKSLYIPEVIVVKDGQIAGHYLSLPEDYDINKADQMDDSQKKELQDAYKQLMNSIAD